MGQEGRFNEKRVLKEREGYNRGKIGKEMSMVYYRNV